MRRRQIVCMIMALLICTIIPIISKINQSITHVYSKEITAKAEIGFVRKI